MFKSFIETLKENFKKRLQQKTNWGKNEVIQEFEKALIEVIVEFLNESLYKPTFLIENKNKED